MKKTLLISLFSFSINLLSTEVIINAETAETTVESKEVKMSPEDLVAKLAQILISSGETLENCSAENEAEIGALFELLQKDFSVEEINEMITIYSAL